MDFIDITHFLGRVPQLDMSWEVTGNGEAVLPMDWAAWIIAGYSSHVSSEPYLSGSNRQRKRVGGAMLDD